MGSSRSECDLIQVTTDIGPLIYDTKKLTVSFSHIYYIKLQCHNSSSLRSDDKLWLYSVFLQYVITLTATKSILNSTTSSHFSPCFPLPLSLILTLSLLISPTLYFSPCNIFYPVCSISMQSKTYQ